MTGSIYFNNAELLGYNTAFNFWGEARNHSNTQIYNIRSYITGAFYQENISGIVAQIAPISNYIKSGICGIYINNVYVGLGRVNSVNFDESSDTRIRNYNASVEISHVAGSGFLSGTGSINNTGTFFLSNGENLINFLYSQTGRYIKGFEMTQATERIGKNKYKYNKSANFSIDQGIYDEYNVAAIDYAKRLFGAVQRTYGNEFTVSPNYPNFYTLGSGAINTSQTFDIISNNYSYSEDFDYEEGQNYLWKYDHSLSYDGNLVSVDENGTITSSSISGTRFNPALAAWTGVQTGIYGRCNQVFQKYTGFLSYTGGCGLYNYPIERSVTKNTCAATINYKQSYSTNPFVNSGYFYSYSNSIEYGEDGYVSISENGSLKALRNISGAGMTLVLSGYNYQKPFITGRISGLYNTSVLGGYNADCYYLSGGLNSLGKTESYNEYDPEITYNWSFTDNPSYHQDAVSYMNKKTYSDTKSVHMFNYFPIINDEIITQSATQAIRGRFSNSINIAGKPGVSISGLISKALSGVQKPSGTDIYAQDYKYSINPLTNNFSLSLDYVYTHYRNKEEFLAY